MGAELILHIIEIDKNKKPDFKAAREHLSKLTNEKVQRVYMKTLKLEEKPKGWKVKDFHLACMEALNTLEEGWNGHSRIFSVNDLSETTILSTGDMSCGDTPEGIYDMIICIRLGLTKAAGFRY